MRTRTTKKPASKNGSGETLKQQTTSFQVSVSEWWLSRQLRRALTAAATIRMF
jgi:hypothetical protein